MGKYNWTINDIEYKLEVLQKKYETAKNEKEQATIMSDINMLECYIDDYYNGTQDTHNIKLLTKYRDLKNILNNINYLWDDYIDFYNYANTFFKDYDEELSLKRNSLSKKDILILTHDFYKQLNPFIYGNFMKLFYRRNDHVTFNPVHPDLNKGLCNGMSTSLLSCKEAYLEIGRNYTIDDVVTTIHEYGHATSALICENHELDNKFLYSEVDTLFLELASLKYLKEVTKDKNVSILKIMDYIENYNRSLDINDMIAIKERENSISGGYKTNKMLKEMAFKTSNIYNEELESIIDNINSNSYVYLTGYLYALELYNTYKEDKEKALNDLKKFICLNANDEKGYYKKIKQLGIIPNLHIDNFNKEISNDLHKLTLKK